MAREHGFVLVWCSLREGGGRHETRQERQGQRAGKFSWGAGGGGAGAGAEEVEMLGEGRRPIAKNVSMCGLAAYEGAACFRVLGILPGQSKRFMVGFPSAFLTRLKLLI